MTERREDHAGRLSWEEVEARLAQGAAAIFPIGAGAKEHGTHLRQDCDLVQAEYLSQALAREIDALIWPTLTYGHYPAFRAFPGSVSLSTETFTTLVREIASEILRASPRRLFILDTGISTIAPVDAALVQGGFATRTLHLRIHAGPRYRTAAESLAEQSFGSHADELETSRMLALAPQDVRMERAQATPAGPFQGPLTRANAPSGSYGDPTLASAEKGRILLDAMLADLIAECRQASWSLRT